ncbi:MAG TPA: hypothetical protein VFA50_20060 [Stellaceae bacterium]|nr:hypothetical protein [Stellaceae bacterium]
MTGFLLAFLVLVFLLGAFAYLAMPAGSRLRRGLVSGAFAVLLAILFFGYSDMLGRPKAMRLEVLRGSVTDARVIGSYLKEGEGIYLWLELPGTAEPRYYRLPWDEKTAGALQEAVERNQSRHGGGVMMGHPFARGWDEEAPKFYALPQPKLPDKAGERPPALTLYQAPEQRS